ncbi:MAG: membrane protein insertase YidC [Clostridiales bacterium]|nr:membrane protein insertase YidC [Clostridiales bacterium]
MIDLIHFATPVTNNFLVDIIKWLIQISSSIALGVILFTIILKLITLPFDFMSRYSMRKNSLKMEEMRPELEKLQKQYANDKNLYNQKMMALYKKNGYSMWGSCLPTIITLVIFIVAINAFTSYSQYQNREYFYNMSNSYNSVIYDGIDADGDLIKYENNTFTVKHKEFYDRYVDNDTPITNNGVNYNVVKEVGDGSSSLTVTTENSYISYKFMYTLENEGTESEKFTVGSVSFIVKDTQLKDTDFKVLIDNEEKLFKDQTTLTASQFLEDVCSQKSAETFREINARFLWVQNIWVTDSPMAHPILDNWDTFKTTYGYTATEEGQYGMTADNYKKLISKLTDEQTKPNGFFILAVLTAGISFLTQFVMNKSQKAQMELQTVDGQGARTQKMMMWMMPIMMAFFAFMYTAAFSIYMIISSVFSILTTLGINWIVDFSFKRKKASQSAEKIRGRVFNKDTTEDEKEKEKQTKPEKKNNENKGDFISGPVKEEKHVRGRLK